MQSRYESMNAPIPPTDIRTIYKGRLFTVQVETVTLPKGHVLHADVIGAGNQRSRAVQLNPDFPTFNGVGHHAQVSDFGRVGIGILDGGRRGLMVTQNFRN